MTDDEFAAFRKKWGGSFTTREEYVQDFLHNQHFEPRLADLLGLLTEDEKRAAPTPAAVQHIHVGSAGVLVGMNNGQLTVNITIQQLFEAVEKAIEKDETIPAEQKPGLIQRLKEFALHPYVANLSTAALWDGFKAMMGVG